MAQSTEKQKMLRGELYLGFDPQLCQDRVLCAERVAKYNSLPPNASDVERLQAWNAIVYGSSPPELNGDDVENRSVVMAPFRCDYGYSVKLGKGVFINFGCTILDVMDVTIGDRTLIGPNVSLYSAYHPLSGKLRSGMKGPELGKPITIGKDCWIGGGAIILPGVVLGDNVTVGAGSVVTKCFPSNVVIAGNPAKVLRQLDAE